MPVTERSDPHVQLLPAAFEQKGVLANLLELYCHDFSAWAEVQISPDGRFGYKHLDLYWTEPDRHPFLIHADGRLAGFVLVGKTEDSVWDMAEFFVLRGYRRRGVGMAAAWLALQRFPGKWQVRVMDANRDARAFWEHSIRKFGADCLDARRDIRSGVEWTVFSFNSPSS
jgi:predicted acetyltransferase